MKRHQWLRFSWSRGHYLWGPACPASPGCTGTTRIASFSLQWKSDEFTKHYLTQKLLAINWWYWQAGKFTHAYEGSRSPHASALHWNPPGFRKKKVEYFSNRVVYTKIKIKNSLWEEPLFFRMQENVQWGKVLQLTLISIKKILFKSFFFF